VFLFSFCGDTPLYTPPPHIKDDITSSSLTSGFNLLLAFEVWANRIGHMDTERHGNIYVTVIEVNLYNDTRFVSTPHIVCRAGTTKTGVSMNID
jgi:hypothetical protein